MKRFDIGKLDEYKYWMKYKLVYWNNKMGWHSEKILEIEVDNILEGDVVLKKKFGIAVEKSPWIGCQVIKKGLTTEDGWVE